MHGPFHVGRSTFKSAAAALRLPLAQGNSRTSSASQSTSACHAHGSDAGKMAQKDLITRSEKLQEHEAPKVFSSGWRFETEREVRGGG
jgi:hypothetical protein